MLHRNVGSHRFVDQGEIGLKRNTYVEELYTCVCVLIFTCIYIYIAYT